jgi:drug/metabolite transporter (DMT)-like permease
MPSPPNNIETDKAPLLPMGSVLLGLAFFSAMDAAMKSLSLSLGPYNAILWRYAVGIVIIGAIYAFQRPKWPAYDIMKIHILRSVMIIFMAYLFFWGLTKVPLAEGVALSFIAPLIALYLAPIFLKESIHPRAIWASLIGLLGVGVMVYEKLAGDYPDEVLWGFAAILLSAVAYAGNLIIQRYQALRVGPVEVSFFQNVIVFAAYLSVAPWFAEVPDLEHWPVIVGAATLAIVSILLVMWGYARAEAQILVNLEYSAFIWAAILGWIFFSEPISLSTVLGTILIVAGCILATRPDRQPVHVETTTI